VTDLAAPPTLVLRRRSTLEPLELDPALEIGAGGEAVVYHVPGDAALVAKIYHDPAIERARKLAVMVANPPAMPEGTSIAWPLDVLIHGGGFAGFVMPFAEGPRVFEFYNPVTRRSTAPGFHAGLLHRAGRNLAAAFDALHAAGYVVGDVNESNLLVSPGDARVTLVDADSLQVRDPDGGVFRSHVGKAEFTPPELQGVSFGEIDRAPEHDRFGLAVLLFLLLMEGTHPFAVRLDGADAVPVEERIRRGLFPHASADDDCHPPRLSPRFDALDEAVREMFARAFVAGHADPAARPTGAEWRDALETAEARLATCAASPLHRHAPHLAACPWCERARLLGGRDPFPVGTAVAAPRPRRVARPRGARGSPPLQPQPPRAAMVAAGHRLRFAFPDTPGWQAVAALLRPDALLSPVVVIPTAAVCAVAGSGGEVPIAILALMLSLLTLVIPQFRKVTGTTAVLALVVPFIALIAHTIPGGAPATAPAYPYRSYQYDPPPRFEPSVVVTPEPPAMPDLPDPPLKRTTYDYLVGDIVSAPVYEAIAMDSEAPRPPADGMALPPNDHAWTAVDVKRRPELANRELVAQVLARFRAVAKPAPAAPDTVVMWLRVGRDGRVPAEGWQVISSTSTNAREAAKMAVPYLRYRPGQAEGRPVSVWVTQRMVFEP
jgi:hypothetical protein